ncbi:MAG: FG-GAP repeat protein [Planctomycetes bacterium]|nr:FG-GAP repeat protein [Planctomycetota bacterium]
MASSSVFFFGNSTAVPQSPPTPTSPALDRTLAAATGAGDVSQNGAMFGYTMSAGKLGGATDVEDDLAVAAISYDDINFNPTAFDAGAGFVFSDQNLTAPSNILFGTTISSGAADHAGEHMGELGNVIGDVRGTSASPQPNLLFLGAYLRDDTYPNCSAQVNDQGAVAVFDLTSSTPNIPKILIPPKDPGETCYPHLAKALGHGLSVADVDGDGISDLIVGAHSSDGGKGRVYIFFGRSDFLTNPITTNSAGNQWLCIKPPSDALVGEEFGATVAAADLDSDPNQSNTAEIVVGAAQRTRAPGRVYIISGAKIHQWKAALTATPSSNNIVQLPVPPTDVYQRFTKGTGTGDQFGWQITIGQFRGNDSALDLAFYSENTQSNVPDAGCASACGGTPGHPSYPSFTGALYIFQNVSVPGSNPAVFVDDVDWSTSTPTGAIKMTSPYPDSTYAPRARFGRGSAMVNWKYSDGSTKNCLLVGEPGAYNHGSCQSGLAWLYELPIIPDSNGNIPLPAIRIESPNVEGCSHFGASIVLLRYDSNTVGQQFAISGREETVGSFTTAGRVYTYLEQ